MFHGLSGFRLCRGCFTIRGKKDSSVPSQALWVFFQLVFFVFCPRAQVVPSNNKEPSLEGSRWGLGSFLVVGKNGTARGSGMTRVTEKGSSGFLGSVM